MIITGTCFYFLKELNAGFQVHAKVHGGPFDAFFFIFLLLQQEHLLVVKLLQLLITEIVAHLLEAINLRVQRRHTQIRTRCLNVLREITGWCVSCFGVTALILQ